MNIQDAKKALKKGKKLTHLSFTPEEWVEGFTKEHPDTYQFEDGNYCDADRFWLYRETTLVFQGGWELVYDK